MPKKRVIKQQRSPKRAGSVFFDQRRGCWKAKVPVGRYPNGTARDREVTAASLAEARAKAGLVAPDEAEGAE